jgi:hypothetical protein
MTKKQEELAEKHGTPEQFEKAIWKAYSDLFISHEEGTSAIRRYQTEWDDAATGYAANAPLQTASGTRASLKRLLERRQERTVENELQDQDGRKDHRGVSEQERPGPVHGRFERNL